MPTPIARCVIEYHFDTVEEFRERSSGHILEAIEKACKDFPSQEDAEFEPHGFGESFVDYMHPGLDCNVEYAENEGLYIITVYDIHQDFVKKVMHLLDHPEDAPLHINTENGLLEAVAKWRLNH
jgi:hypothetical protein